jgi:hypothetical protein
MILVDLKFLELSLHTSETSFYHSCRFLYTELRWITQIACLFLLINPDVPLLTEKNVHEWFCKVSLRYTLTIF